ncbi:MULTISPECIES: hypothetical protein [Cyanophyceae]|uniref:hypothetical protein n=1 Tax=Cyanophyceae TaxID=3028117 RepID=UPI0016824614|nr:hypothetical protein [Trichocoleus sp. FACHB-40]MBD2003548.1 hypothetical protein [Trichocoleus sp. FACHB-40]
MLKSAILKITRSHPHHHRAIALLCASVVRLPINYNRSDRIYSYAKSRRYQ